MKHIVVGNWKLYVEKPEAVKKFAALRRYGPLLKKIDTIIAPPLPLIQSLAQTLGSKSPLRLGAQTVSPWSEGAHTGEVSAAALKSVGVSHVIIGHSERRAAGESDATIAEQMERAHAAGLTAILCVGEVERDALGGHFSLMAAQLTSALAHKPKSKLIVAYEPVWAIGKSAEQAMQGPELQEMVIFIRKTLADVLGRQAALKTPVLYGGSVDSSNAQNLLQEGGVAGFLVGRASAQVESFIEILKVCQTQN